MYVEAPTQENMIYKIQFSPFLGCNPTLKRETLYFMVKWVAIIDQPGNINDQ